MFQEMIRKINEEINDLELQMVAKKAELEADKEQINKLKKAKIQLEKLDEPTTIPSE